MIIVRLTDIPRGPYLAVHGTVVSRQENKVAPVHEALPDFIARISYYYGTFDTHCHYDYLGSWAVLWDTIPCKLLIFSPSDMFPSIGELCC